MTTVLVVDDQPDTRLLMRMVLERAGYEVIEAETAADGRRLAEKERPGLVLLDARLPDADGFAVLRDLRADPALEGLPVVICSADSSPQAREQAGAAGADDYLSKPFDSAELLALIARLTA